MKDYLIKFTHLFKIFVLNIEIRKCCKGLSRCIFKTTNNRYFVLTRNLSSWIITHFVQKIGFGNKIHSNHSFGNDSYKISTNAFSVTL